MLIDPKLTAAIDEALSVRPAGSGNPAGEISAAVEPGHELLEDVFAFVARFVAASLSVRVAAVLWVAHAHALAAFDVSPRFSIRSKEPGSGKTRFLEVLKVLAPHPLSIASTSEAALFRRIDAGPVTILHDEIDAVFGTKARDREDLRALLNAGWERGATVARCVGEKHEVREHEVFAPIALAGLGRLPETLEQRSVIARLKKRAPDETVARFRKREIGPEAEALRDRLAAWCAAHVSDLEAARPELPDKLTDRAQDLWEPLVAIADAAGRDWPARARTAALELREAAAGDGGSLGVRLLADIKIVFDDPAVEKHHDDEKGDGLASGDLAKALADLEGAPWAEFSSDDKPLSANRLARLVHDYGIRPDQHKMTGHKIRGYLRADFEDAWRRYLPQPSGTDKEVVPPNPNKGKAGTTSTPVPLLQEGTDLAAAWRADRDGVLDPDLERASNLLKRELDAEDVTGTAEATT
jgi:hypothetical protein